MVFRADHAVELRSYEPGTQASSRPNGGFPAVSSLRAIDDAGAEASIERPISEGETGMIRSILVNGAISGGVIIAVMIIGFLLSGGHGRSWMSSAALGYLVMLVA